MRHPWVVPGLALAACAGALVVLDVFGVWAGPVQALIATGVSLGLVGAVAGLGRTRGWDGTGARPTRIAASMTLGWFLVFGIVLAGAGAPPEPYAWDIGSNPTLPVRLEQAQTMQVVVGAVWALAGSAGLLAIGLASRGTRAGI